MQNYIVTYKQKQTYSGKEVGLVIYYDTIQI